MVFHKYTESENKFIHEYAFGHSYKEIRDEFNKRFSAEIGENQIKAYLNNHKIITGRTGRFEKGHVPANKGTHIGGWKPTQFKKGNIPPNHKPVGTESVRNHYKRNERYVYVKVAEPNQWKMKHIIEWEQHFGPVPEGKVIIFLDGNTLNTDISNLQCIDRKTHVRINQNHLRYNDAELTKTGVQIANVISKLSERKKSRKE